MLRVIAPLLVLIVAGCSGQPRLDTSSDAAFKSSLDRMSKGMTAEESKQLVEDVMTVAFAEAINVPRPRNDGEKQPAARVVASLNGLTAAEIHARAEELRRAKAGK
jgi:hypothetical protein